MYYMISIKHLPDELVKEIQMYLPSANSGFIFIKKNDLSLHNSYVRLFDEEWEPIDVDKLRELLVLKRLKE